MTKQELYEEKKLNEKLDILKKHFEKYGQSISLTPAEKQCLSNAIDEIADKRDSGAGWWDFFLLIMMFGFGILFGLQIAQQLLK